MTDDSKQSRLVRTAKLLALPFIGMGLIVAGFMYDVIFAGIPYQDPTPALEAKWQMHKQIAGIIASTGLIIALVGIVVSIVAIVRQKKS